jgi:hypothetical protein
MMGTIRAAPTVEGKELIHEPMTSLARDQSEPPQKDGVEDHRHLAY